MLVVVKSQQICLAALPSHAECWELAAVQGHSAIMPIEIAEECSRLWNGEDAVRLGDDAEGVQGTFDDDAGEACIAGLLCGFYPYQASMEIC